MKIYLIRHGRQCSPLCNVNVELAAEGRRQAELLAERLAAYYHVDAIYSSSLLRALQTAEILGARLGIPPAQGNPAWNEIDFGELTGHSDSEIQQLYGSFMAERKKMQEDLAFPGGECGRQVWERGYPALCGVAESGCREAVVVTHGGVIRSLAAGILGMDQKYKLAIAKTLENSSMTVLDYQAGNRRFTLETLNDSAHLLGHPELFRSAIK